MRLGDSFYPRSELECILGLFGVTVGADRGLRLEGLSCKKAASVLRLPLQKQTSFRTNYIGLINSQLLALNDFPILGLNIKIGLLSF